MTVPKPLRGQVGKSIIRCSLGTTSIGDAKELAREMRAKLLRQWGTLPVRRIPTDAELEEAAVVIGHDLAQEHADAARKELAGLGPDLFKAFVEWNRMRLDDQAYQSTIGDFSNVRALADEVIEALDFEIDRDGEQYAKLCALLNSSRLSALKVTYKRSLGDPDAVTDNKLVQRVREREAATAGPGQKIAELFEDWAADMLAKDEKRSDTVNMDRKIIEQFADFVGKDRSIRSITPIKVADYRDTLHKLPPKWKSTRC